MAHTLDEEQPRRSPGMALRQRFNRAASRARSAGRSRRKPEPEAPPAASREPEPPPEPQPPAEPEPAAQATEEPAPAAPRTAKPRPRRESPERRPKRPAKRAPDAAKAPRSRRAKRGPEALMRRAVERFNSSEERRKVAGLMRSLGEPQAGVRPEPRRQLALVTVAWELSWYQWEVVADGNGDEPVREVAKGAEVSELDDAARAWNAVVDEDGTLRLRSAAELQRQEAANEA